MMILGLDLSLSNAGMVALPVNWGGDFSRIERRHVGHSLPKNAPELRRVGRLHQIASEVIMFSKRHGCDAAIVENYAFGARFERERLGELCGAVKLALISQAGISAIEAVPPKTARKFLLGAEPKSNAKAHVREMLLSAGMPRVWTDDEMDAFVVANWFSSGIGGYALASEAA